MKSVNFKVFQDKIMYYLEKTQSSFLDEREPQQKLIYGQLFSLLNNVYQDYDKLVIQESEELLRKTMNDLDGTVHLFNNGTFYEYLKNKVDDYMNKSKIEKEPYRKWAYDEMARTMITLLSDYNDLVLK